MAKTNPFQFMQQVRAETAKVTWPTRREVTVTTVMVLIMAALTAVFFFLVDLTIRTGLSGLLGCSINTPSGARLMRAGLEMPRIAL